MTQPRTPDMVFVSHANPEDNDFARWLALQLANEGYPVWCDLTRLLGGEKFWEHIQNAISNRTARFLFALSRSSNTKSGTLDELNCALGVEKKCKLKDFVITLKLDDLPYDDVYINVQRRNHIDFRSSWASGFSQLLKKLVDENVPKDVRFNPDAVSSWWRSQNEFSAEQGLLQQQDEHLSNWFPIGGLPSHINRHPSDDLGRLPTDQRSVDRTRTDHVGADTPVLEIGVQVRTKERMRLGGISVLWSASTAADGRRPLGC